MTPRSTSKQRYRRVIACKHSYEDMEDELMIIIDYGGTVIDVVVEHEVYGEFRAELMLSSPYEVKSFSKDMQREGVKPLSSLRQGIHLHTIEAEDPKILDKIEVALREKGYILED